ncbi:MAG: hypothetical protein JWO80_2402 [Bryobacterales bacterium]|nr:hypothetical protein [Bryobacterales bacterium]
MKSASISKALGCVLALAGAAGQCQSFPNMAMNAPDELAWRLFLQVNAAAPGVNNALFETWTSDSDTFQLNPAFPTGPSPIRPRPPVIPSGGQAVAAPGISRRKTRAAPLVIPLRPVPPKPDLTGEEVRRNRDAFDFIVKNKLYTVSGLKAAAGKSFSFPPTAIEIKAEWLPVEEIPAFMLNRIALADVPRQFHVNTAADGKQYGLIAMHIITKLVPNWTWDTFEHELNPARCDIIGCNDQFGMPAPGSTPANTSVWMGYGPCLKTEAVRALFASAKWDSAFEHYCLKGTQTDFSDRTGLAIRLGNSIAEKGFVQQSSCMTCHARAAWGPDGKKTSHDGFDENGPPLGAINLAWFWKFTGNPPIFVGMGGLTQTATSADFVWSVARCAYDDTATPPKIPCGEK